VIYVFPGSRYEKRTQNRDCFINMGFTMQDLCNTDTGFGFLFGEAQLDKVGSVCASYI